MRLEVWDYIWLGITVVAAIVEAAVPALVSVWFGPGGLAALVASLFGAPLWRQVALFLVVSGAALILTRPLVKRIQSRKTISTNADMVLGKTALVTEEINNLLGAGRVTVLGNSGSARAADPESVIPSGEKVIVEKIEGVKLIVHQGYQS